MHTISGLVADEVLHAAAKARSLDNISVVFVAFKNFRLYVEQMQDQEFFTMGDKIASQKDATVEN